MFQFHPVTPLPVDQEVILGKVCSSDLTRHWVYNGTETCEAVPAKYFRWLLTSAKGAKRNLLVCMP